VDLVGKLQLKSGQSVAVLDLPADVTLDLPSDIVEVESPDEADAVLAFVTDSGALDGSATGDAVIAAKADRLSWLLYPKAGQLGTDLNRDRLAAALKARGVRPVRQVSVDAIWSALRFRPGTD
jgi:hypothetical protein